MNKDLFTPSGAKATNMIQQINKLSKLSKFADRNTPAGRDNDELDDQHGDHYNNRRSSLQSHPIHRTNTSHGYEDDLAQTLSSLALPLPYHSHISLPPPSELLAGPVESEHNLS